MVIDSLRHISRTAAKEPTFANILAKQNLSIVYKDQPEFAAVIQKDNARFKDLLGSLGMLSAAK